MEPIRARRSRLHPLLGAFLIAALEAMTTMAGATTIDFETPSLTGADEVSISPLEIQGVRFIGLANGSLVRESAIFPCDGLSATNQAYGGWAVTWGCIDGCCESQLMRIEFPGPEPVTHLALEARSYSGPLFLRTWDAAGNRNETSLSPAPVACSMAIRGTLEISTPQPIVAAEIWSGNRLPDGCCDGCITFGSTILIDNVTFDGGSVPTTRNSWGRLKGLYR